MFNECVAGIHTILFEFFDARQLTEIKHKIVSCFETGKFRLFMGCHWMEMGESIFELLFSYDGSCTIQDGASFLPQYDILEPVFIVLMRVILPVMASSAFLTT